MGVGVGGDLVGDSREQLVLAGEVVRDQPTAAEPGLLADGVEGGGLVATLAQQGDRGTSIAARPSPVSLSYARVAALTTLTGAFSRPPGFLLTSTLAPRTS
ncbi:hypothetical protein [Nonomuraea sp. NPDC052265]|uniref:hypothetical protein n=1 Tax=Nonomuraea sp. NPDC052265 TaxID=3364374 RepID=UPI0037C721E6